MKESKLDLGAHKEYLCTVSPKGSMTEVSGNALPSVLLHTERHAWENHIFVITLKLPATLISPGPVCIWTPGNWLGYGWTSLEKSSMKQLLLWFPCHQCTFKISEKIGYCVNAQRPICILVMSMNEHSYTSKYLTDFFRKDTFPRSDLGITSQAWR